MSRARAILAFVFSGGLLVFLSPYLIYEALIKKLPWPVPVIAIPIYALLSYGALRRFWPHVLGTSATMTYRGSDRDEPK